MLTTGSNLQKPSDNPVGATRVLSLESQQAGIARNLDTISSAQAFLDSGASSLIEISGVITRIREEGLHHSRAMETLRHLTEEIGPRLTGSPQMKQAGE